LVVLLEEYVIDRPLDTWVSKALVVVLGSLFRHPLQSAEVAAVAEAAMQW
jgi:hypothetical protein